MTQPHDNEPTDRPTECAATPAHELAVRRDRAHRSAFALRRDGRNLAGDVARLEAEGARVDDDIRTARRTGARPSSRRSGT